MVAIIRPPVAANGWAAAKTLIDNPGRFGVSLLQNYADVHKEGNDYNAEILYSVERVPGDGVDNEQLNGVLQLLINIRKEAKAKKDFVTSDTIRNELIKLGVQLKDEKDGTVSYSVN